MKQAYDIVPNRVFVGCAWRPEKAKYERIIAKLEKSFPLHFVLVGRETDQKAQELLGLIKQSLFSSGTAIFDVTNGNPNVSLEYGLADARNMEVVLYLSAHKASRKGGGEGAIIADLAGQKRKQYTNEPALEKLLRAFCTEHSYTKLFEYGLKKTVRNVKDPHKKKALRHAAMKLIRLLDYKDEARRDDVVTHLQGEGYSRDDIEFLIKGLHKNEVIVVSRGHYATVSIA